MLGNKNFGKKDIVLCNQTQMDLQVKLDTMFMKNAASYVNPNCSGE